MAYSARRRILGTLAPAAVGCFAGYLYGENFADPDLSEKVGLPGLYATLGAASALMIVRLGGLLWMIVRDLRSPR